MSAECSSKTRKPGLHSSLAIIIKFEDQFFHNLFFLSSLGFPGFLELCPTREYLGCSTVLQSSGSTREPRRERERGQIIPAECADSWDA